MHGGKAMKASVKMAPILLRRKLAEDSWVMGAAFIQDSISRWRLWQTSLLETSRQPHGHHWVLLWVEEAEPECCSPATITNFRKRKSPPTHNLFFRAVSPLHLPQEINLVTDTTLLCLNVIVASLGQLVSLVFEAGIGNKWCPDNNLRPSRGITNTANKKFVF